MPQHTSLHGIHIPLVTPFTTEGHISEDALEGLAHAVLDAGATGIVALGTTSEAATLNAEEKRAVVDVCALVCRERGATLLIGAGTNDTRASVAALAELTRWPQAAGALVLVPSFIRPSKAGVLAHFTELAAVSPVPLVVYHVPYRTARPLDAATLRALGRLSRVVGVKYAAGGIDQETVDLLGDLPPGFAVLAGDDVFLSPLLALGASGGILASAHLATSRFVELAAAWQGGHLSRARDLGHALTRLSAAVFAEPNPTVIKGVLHAQGRIPTPDVRLPLLPAGRDSVEEALKRLTDLDA
jgi:4-hydroxy-tetrahydrodipicolinate synthase